MSYQKGEMSIEQKRAVLTLTPKKNKDFARFQLSEMKQQSREKLSDYYAKIRDIARKCDYGTHEDDAIRDHLIRTMLNNKIRSKAIRENWNLDRILTETALDEQTSEQAGARSKKLDTERSSERIKKIAARKPRNANQVSCLRCGSSQRHQRHETCPAMGATCDNCGKLNHYARVCLGKPQQQNDGRRENRQRNQRPRNVNSNNRDYQRNETKRDNNGTSNYTQRQRARAKHIENQGGDDSSTSSDDECYMHHLQSITQAKTTGKPAQYK